MHLFVRYITIIFWIGLQFIAPLVHAHIGKQSLTAINFTSGFLHVPGLEIYDADSFPVRHLEMPISTGLNHQLPIDGLLIGIDTGIKSRQHFCAGKTSAILPRTATNRYFLPVSRLQTDFSVDQPHSVLIHSSLPRAPPSAGFQSG